MPATAKSIVEQRHSLYLSNSPLWQYFADHAAGGPLYAQKPNPLFAGIVSTAGNLSNNAGGRYVVRHPLEDSSDYLLRLSKAVCVNLCGPAIGLLAGTVGSADSVTLDIPPDFQPIVDDCDLMGDSFSQFMLDARTQAAVYGHVFLLCDSTRASGEILTQADVQAQGIRPYFRTILPSEMLNWRLDSNGRPIEVLFRVPIENPGSLLDGADANEQIYEYRYWSRAEWIVFRQDGQDIAISDQGANPVGEIPVAVLYHHRLAPFLGESLLKESARYSHLLSNWLSDLDSTMMMQSFSQACIRSETKPSEVGVGTDRIIQLRPGRKEGDVTYESEDFFYRAPDSAPLQTMWDSFFQVVSLANETMSLQPEATTDKAHPESGISRAWRWHSTEKRLTQMAINEQEAARYLFYFAARWMGQSAFQGSIVYGTSFDLNDLEQDLQAMVSLQTMGLPPTAQTELKARIMRKALPNLDPKVQSKIDAEMQRMLTAAPAVNDRVASFTQG
jgi:hypothetical protein